jgi:hypothetical protein
MAKAVLGIAVWLVLALPHPAAYADKNNPAWRARLAAAVLADQGE